MARSSKAVAAPAEEPAFSPIRRLLWLVGVVLWGLLTASVLSYDPADPPGHAVAPLNGPGELSNWIGPVGAAAAHWSLQSLGSGVWVMIASAGLALLLVAFRGPVDHAAVRAVGVALVAMAVSGLHALLLPGLSSMPEGAGGLIAIAGTSALVEHFGRLGALMWVAMLGAIGATVAYDRWLIVVPRAAWRWASAGLGVGLAGARAVRARRSSARANDVDDDRALRAMTAVTRNAARQGRAGRAEDHGEGDRDTVGSGRSKRSWRDRLGLGRATRAETEAAAPAPVPAPADAAQAPPEADEEAWDDEYEYVDEDGNPIDEADAEWEDEAEPDGGDADDEPEAAADGRPLDPDALREKIAKLPLRFAKAGATLANEDDLEQLRAQRRSEEEADRRYTFPTLDLLSDPEENYSAELETYVRDQAEALEHALHTYKIQGEVVGIDSGPVITLYQVRLAPGTKVSSITSVSSDLARMLRAVNVRIVPNTEGLDTVGIEVPNTKKEKVRLKELMASSETTTKMKLPLFLGKDASGSPLIVDLASLPHMLIAGTTGSGKSVCMNAIIMGFLYTQKPSDLKLVLVDPKMVELSQFKDIPHLMCPVVTEMSKAAAILEWAVGKMDERYELLAEAGCRDISGYNALGWEELKERLRPATEMEEAKIPRKLPYMVFIIDELADLMMTNKEVESAIVRIAQKARAVGIHLILATQRPQANVVTGLIKSNMPGRLSFKVASGMDSRIVLDQKGGELLLGQGDMLMLTPRSSVAIRAQGTLVDDGEIRRVVRSVRDDAGQNFEGSLVSIGNSGMSAQTHEARMREHAQEDPLFDRAVELVIETKRGSVSMLQRRLAIGYTRAARLIEMMGDAGIIGDHKGTVAREVTLTLDEWHAMKALADQEPVERPDAQPALFDERDTDTPALSPTNAPGSPGSPASDDDLGDLDAVEEEAAVVVHAARVDEDEEPAADAPPFAPDAADAPGEDERRRAIASVVADVGAAARDDAPAPDANADHPADGDQSEDDEEYEYEYVDEDGNPIDPEELDDEEWEYEYEESDDEESEDEESEGEEPEDEATGDDGADDEDEARSAERPEKRPDVKSRPGRRKGRGSAA